MKNFKKSIFLPLVALTCILTSSLNLQAQNKDISELPPFEIQYTITQDFYDKAMDTNFTIIYDHVEQYPNIIGENNEITPFALPEVSFYQELITYDNALKATLVNYVIGGYKYSGTVTRVGPGTPIGNGQYIAYYTGTLYLSY